MPSSLIKSSLVFLLFPHEAHTCPWSPLFTQVQLQLLTAIVKLFLKKPTETQELVQQVLSLATQVGAPPPCCAQRRAGSMGFALAQYARPSFRGPALQAGT